jgi:carbamoyltransferase
MTPLVLGVHTGPHDGAAAVFEDYTLKAAIQQERLSRDKGDGRSHPNLAIDEALSIAGVSRRDVDVIAYSRSLFPTRYFRDVNGLRWLREQFRTYLGNKPRIYMLPEMMRLHTTEIGRFFDVEAFQRDSGFRSDATVYFYNHHEAHALPALFYSPWDDALLVTADGGGDTVHYSQRHFGNGRLSTIYGGEDLTLTPPTEDSLGKAYGAVTKALGFRRVRHEGKVTGLAARGQPTQVARIAARFSVDERGRIYGDFKSDREIYAFMNELAASSSREDMACSIQTVLEDTMLTSMQRLLAQNPARHLGVAGGVFANVKLNRVLAEQLPIDELFIFPAMGDEGLPIGGALAYLLERDGLPRWLDCRQPLGDVYLGRDYSDSIDRTLSSTQGVQNTGESPIEGTAQRLHAGEIGAIYVGRMEYGPRALGARSILANPSRRETHDQLNSRLDRSDFMPFAPVIAADRAAEVFDVNTVNSRACRYMTIACDVRPPWRSRIPAVVHVDHSARPQTIERASNPLYYDVLAAFERVSGIPVLVNTSCNVHEEPIVNSPAECARALTDGRIDFVVTERGLYKLAGR